MFLSLGQLLTRFAEKGIQYRITSNAVEKSIIWNMSVPEHITHVIKSFISIYGFFKKKKKVNDLKI